MTTPADQATIAAGYLIAIAGKEAKRQAVLAEAARLLAERDDLIRDAVAIRPRIRRAAIAEAAGIGEAMLHKVATADTRGSAPMTPTE